jgi:hypothetical protein
LKSAVEVDKQKKTSGGNAGEEKGKQNKNGSECGRGRKLANWIGKAKSHLTELINTE